MKTKQIITVCLLAAFLLWTVLSKRHGARFLTALFCLFLGGLMVWQFLLPDRERSDVENRTLQQAPALTLSGVLDGSYMEDVESYVQDQFPLRDEWTGLKARTEQLIGKRLFNNIYLCEGETLISKVDVPADGLEETNLGYVTRLAGNTDIPVYLGLIPSAAEVQRTPQGRELYTGDRQHGLQRHVVLPVRHSLADAGHHGILGEGGRPDGHLLAHRLPGARRAVRPELSDGEGQILLLLGGKPAPVRHPQ